MQFDSAIIRAFSIVDRALKQQFPSDYFKRCMYAAFGMQGLLRQLGHDAAIVGGDIVAFMLSQDGRNASMQGFAGETDGHSHFWLTAENRILDIGPFFLPRDARHPSVAVPFIAWPLREPLPAYLRYRPEQNYGTQVALMSDAAIQERLETFMALCSKKLGEQVGQPKLPHWILSGHASIRDQAKKGDLWAQGALRFVRVQSISELPF